MTLRKMAYNLRKRHDSVLQPIAASLPPDLLRLIFVFYLVMPKHRYRLRSRLKYRVLEESQN